MNFKFFLFVVFMVSFSFGRIITDTVKTDYIRSNPDIDSTKGNTIHTGNYTITSTLTADSIKSTNGINATGGTFSSRVTATDFQASDSIIGVTGTFDSVKLGTGSYLKTYVEGTMACTLKTTDVTVQHVGVIKYSVINNTVFLTFPFIYGTSNSTTLRLYCGGLNGVLDPGQKICYDIPYVTDNGTSKKGVVVYYYGFGNMFEFKLADGTSFTNSGSKGVGGWLTTNSSTITYTK